MSSANVDLFISIRSWTSVAGFRLASRQENSPKLKIEHVAKHHGINLMNFRNWMVANGLKEKSASSYDGAIAGRLSEWSKDAGLIRGSLYMVLDPMEFVALGLKIRKLSPFKKFDERGHGMYNAALAQYQSYLEGEQNSSSKDIEFINTRKDIANTDKETLIKARVGQGDFRQNLIDKWGACAVTGFKILGLLTASHIKPWSKSSDVERLDPNNGLLLSPNLDKAFDRGFISFDEDGRIMISKDFQNHELLGINDEMRVITDADIQDYMAHHRNEVWIS